MIWAAVPEGTVAFFIFICLLIGKNDYLCMRNTDRLRFRMIKKSPGGGIGRRARFRCEWFCDRAGSSPVLGTLLLKKGESSHAEIAQLVEHNLAKVRVASSSLVFRSFQIKKSRKHCSVLAGFFCCMEVVVTVSVMRIRASFRRSCWPASRYSSEWSCCFCWRGRLSVSVACPIRTAGP